MNRNVIVSATALVALGLVGCTGSDETVSSASAVSEPAAKPAAASHSKMTIGNGEKNNIQLDGATRAGSEFSFPRVEIDNPGFLVMHPFKDGKPVQTEYVGAVPVATGVSKDVKITVSDNPATGDMYIVMLHYDVNDDRVFDFNDGVTVPDKPVFEGTNLVALRYQAP